MREIDEQHLRPSVIGILLMMTNLANNPSTFPPSKIIVPVHINPIG